MGLFHRSFLSFLRDGRRAAAITGLVWLNAFRATDAAAQSQPAQTGPQHYFLFVVESSRSMQPRLQGSLDVMQGLLNSAFNGQMRSGDILDAWVFNDAVSKAGPPAQADTQEARATLSVRLLDFVMSQAADKKTSFDKVLPNLSNLLRDSPLITVILITSGENEMHGTVCDGLINNSYRRLHDAQQKVEKPLVTVFRAVQGQVTDCKVIPAPERIALPPLPDLTVFRPEANSITTAPAPDPTNAPARVAPKPKAPPATVSAKPTNTVPSSLTQAKTNRPVETKPVFEPRVTELATATSEVPPVATPPPAPATPSPQPSVAETQAPRTETPTKPEMLLASTDSSVAAAQLAATRNDAAPTKPETPVNKADVPAAEPQPSPTKPEPAPAKEETPAKTESSSSPADPPPRPAPPPASAPPKAAVETPAAPVETGPSVPSAPAEPSKQPDLLASARVVPPPPQPASVQPAPVEKAPTPSVLAVSLPPATQRSFLRENGKFLLLSGLAVLGAAFCFYNWFKSYLDRSRR